MPQGQKPVWYEGMTMAPHHLQQADEYHEVALNSRVGAHVPYPRGVLWFKLSESDRVNHRFKIERLEVVTDDGMLISIPEHDPAPEGVAVGQLFTASDAVVDVYLAVPEVGEDQNFLLDGGSSPHEHKPMLRYRSVPGHVADQTTGKNRLWIDFAHKNIRLLFGDEPRTGYSTILIARIRKTAEGFELVGEHVPPLLNVQASPWLEAELAKLTAKLQDKIRHLSDESPQAGGAPLLLSLNHDITNSWLLYTVNTAYPVLDSLRRLPLLHPLQLYTELLRLDGALATFSDRARQEASIAYDHDALFQTFNPLFRRIHRLLDHVRPTDYVRVPLTSAVEGRYAGPLAAPWSLEEAGFYLGVFVDMPSEDLRPLMKDVPEAIKVTSPEDLEARIKYALGGLPLRAVTNNKLPFPSEMGYQYFKVEREVGQQDGQKVLDQEEVNRLWGAILGTEQIAMFVPKGRLRDAQLQMFICKP